MNTQTQCRNWVHRSAKAYSYAGTIVVEGVDDIAFLEVAFPTVARKFYITEKGGRKEVEKAVAKIQELETGGERVSPMYIIHDKDDDVGNLKSSSAVKILSWPRYCLENFLIDLDVITQNSLKTRP